MKTLSLTQRAIIFGSSILILFHFTNITPFSLKFWLITIITSIIIALIYELRIYIICPQCQKTAEIAGYPQFIIIKCQYCKTTFRMWTTPPKNITPIITQIKQEQYN